MKQTMKPIIFSTKMVQAILDDRKTQTRRVIRPQPDGVTVDGIAYKHVTREFVDKINGKLLRLTHDRNGDPFAERIKPRYRPGDTLYVREAWLEENGRYFYRADYEDGLVDPCETLSGGYPSECRYYPECVGCQRTAWRPPWKPSIYMPKDAARLFLLVKRVWPEQLQDITEEDAIAEGIVYTDFGQYAPNWKASLDGGKTFHSAKPQQHNGWHYGTATTPEQCMSSARDAFAQLWDRLNAKRGFPWMDNDWVWVVEFERTEGEAE